MGALFVVGSGVGEAEGVGLSASAHRHVGPPPVGTTGDDGESVAGGDALAGMGSCVRPITGIDVDTWLKAWPDWRIGRGDRFNRRTRSPLNSSYGSVRCVGIIPTCGARRIRELIRAGIDPPAVSTVHQVLVRNGLVAAQPPRRPRVDERFEGEIANDLWQIDATRIPVEGGTNA